MTSDSSSTSEGFVSPVEFFRSFEVNATEAEELKARAEAILRMLEHPDKPPPTLVLPAKLIVRESSAPPKIRSSAVTSIADQ